jgi:hypothetical protein
MRKRPDQELVAEDAPGLNLGISGTNLGETGRFLLFCPAFETLPLAARKYLTE